MRGELGDYAKGLRGHVRLLSNTVAIAELLPDALAAFLSAHPNIDVELEDRPSREMVRTKVHARRDALGHPRKRLNCVSLLYPGSRSV